MHMGEAKKSMVFVSRIVPDVEEEFNSLLLVESFRKNGGKLAGSPIWLYYPANQGEFSSIILDRLNELDVKLISYSLDRNLPRVFFLSQVHALMAAEKSARDQYDYLVWMDSNSLVLNEPVHFLLPANKQVGYKPVHHLLLGPKLNKPLNPFWSEIYDLCEVNPDRVFPMQSIIDDVAMKPYFNAGFLVASPQNALFATWMDYFQQSLANPIIKEYISKDKMYEIFLHQAILSGVIMKKFNQSQLIELPETYNYPLHLWKEDYSNKRPISLDRFNTIRHEGLLDLDTWMNGDPFNKDQVDWIKNRISLFKNRQ
jgi:hypothetical protein